MPKKSQVKAMAARTGCTFKDDQWDWELIAPPGKYFDDGGTYQAFPKRFEYNAPEVYEMFIDFMGNLQDSP